MSYQSYKDLEIYQLAHALAVDIHIMTTKKLPDFEKYEEGAQIRKSSKSICSNIVEGFGRRRDKNEFILFLTYALASCDETREHLGLLWDTGSLKDKEFYQHFNQKYDELAKKITKFIQAAEIGHLPSKSRTQEPGASKGAALIIVIFAMMLFAILGWTLLNLQSGDFEMNLRALNSEQALYIADAGAQWALNQLSQDFNCINITNITHSLGPGQYACNCSSSGNALTVISTGYVPSPANYRALRQVNLTLTRGGFSNVATGGNRFDWDNTRGYSVYVAGTIASPNFEGNDTDTTINELEDIPAGVTPIIGPTSIPAINMTYFLNNADVVFNTSQNFTTDQNNQGLYYVKGNVTLSTGTTGNGLNFQHTSVIAEGNITITGTKQLSMKAHVKTSSHETFPNLATQYGNITSSAPSTNNANDRNFDGLIYTQYGTIDFNCIQNKGGLMGLNIYLRRNVDIQYTGKYVETTGFNISGNLSSTTWQEQ